MEVAFDEKEINGRRVHDENKKTSEEVPFLYPSSYWGVPWLFG